MNTGETFLRYLLVGATSNGLGFLAYAILTALGLAPGFAVTLLYTLAAVLGFFWNRTFTFDHQGHRLSAALRYGFIQLSGCLLNVLLLTHFVKTRGYPHLWVQGLLIPVVAIYLFVLLRVFAFKEAQSDSIPA